MSHTHTKTLDGSAFRQDLQGLKQGMDVLKNDVGDLAHGAEEAARSGVAELRQGARQAVEAARGKVDDAAQAAGEAADSLRGVIVRNPVASIGIAVGAGLLIGMLIRRSRS